MCVCLCVPTSPTFSGKERDSTASTPAAEEDKDIRGLNMLKSGDEDPHQHRYSLTGQGTLKSQWGSNQMGTRDLINFNDEREVPRIRKNGG